MSTIQLRPRATAALGVVATSLFLLLCLANYGAGGFADAADPALHLRIAGWFVEIFGAGAFVLVLLPLVWGVVVYFHEETPDLKTRAFGTVLLAAAVSLIAGLLQGADAGLWTGGIGVVGVWLVEALDGFLWAAVAHTIVWTVSLALFVVALVWATDWMFHTLRRGGARPASLGSHDLPTEDIQVELREPDETASTEREFVTHTADAAIAAREIPTMEDRPAATPEAAVPDGFSAREQAGRVLLSGPSGYEGVEFLPPSNDLAVPEEPQGVVAPEFDEVFEIFDEPLPEDVDLAVASEPAPDPVEAAAAPAAPDTYAAEEDQEPEPAEVPAREPEPVAETVVPETEPETVTAADALDEERPRSGIGYPEDSPFVDEVFTVGVLVDDVITPTPEPAEAVEETPVAEDEPEPAWAEPEPAPSRLDDVLVDEVFETPVAYAVVDDVELPGPIRERTEPAPPAATAEPAPEEAATPLPADGRLPFAETPEVAAPEPTGDLDPRFDEAVDAVLERGRASAMVLQRVMGIGHARGLRLLREMEELGVVGPESGTGSREILVTREEWSATAG